MGFWAWLLEPPAEVYVSRGDYVRGYKTVQRLGHVSTSQWIKHRSTNVVRDELMEAVRSKGGNALLHYTWHRSRRQTPFGWEAVFWGEGEAAIIRPRGS
jgi:hypothetical protein